MDKNQYRILVVEDNPGDFTLVEDFLFEQIEAPLIVWAKNFGQAKQNLLTADIAFDVVLLDLSLPDNPRESLINDMLAIGKNIPLIVLTGYADFAFGVRSLSLGISDYILKDELTPTSLHKSIIYSLERQKSIAELQESEKKYSDLFNLSPLPMWVVDLNTLKFLDVNKATIAHYGYTREEFLAMTIKDIRPTKEVPFLMHVLEDDREHPDQSKTRVMVHQLKTGELRNVEVQIAPFNYKNAHASIVTATDVTERFSYIKAIEEQNERLREISWIQSHIVRAPLSRIMGLIPLIMSTGEGSDEMKQMLGYLTKSANDLDDVIKSITDKITGTDE